MVIKLTDFAAFAAFFLAWCSLFLGWNALWVLPSGLLVTYALVWAYYKWVNPPTVEEAQELHELCQETPESTQPKSCAHCQNEKQ